MGARFLICFLIIGLFYSVTGKGAELKTLNDAELIQYLFEKAVSISRLPAYPLEKVPTIYILSPEQIITEVCPTDPTDCQNLAALFDDIHFRILVRNDIPLNSAFGYSFVIHELVHSLQFRNRGPEIFKNCDELFKTESEAYKVQDAYLKAEGEFYRASMTLRYFHCNEDNQKTEYEKSLKVWLGNK